MKTRIHYHSDCVFFAGCENMLVNFFQDEALMDKYEVSFGYRYSAEYETGFRSRVRGNNFRSLPLRLLDFDSFIGGINSSRSGTAASGLKLVLYLLQARLFFILWDTIILYRQFRKLDIDLLHINNGGYPGACSCIAAVFAAKLLRIEPVIFVVNNVASDYSRPHRWLDRPLDRLVSRCVSKFITGSRYAGDILQKTLGLPDGKLCHMHNGIFSRQITESRQEVYRRLGLDEKVFTIAIVALLEKRKGHIYALSALEHLRESGRDMPCLIIEGSGPEAEELKKYVADKGLAGHVRFIGTEKNVFNLMNAVDCIILPSISNEDFPNVVLEAMGLGKAVIATRIAGIPEQIEHMKTGILVDPQDPVAIAESIGALMADRGLAGSLGESARAAFAAEFTAKQAVARYCDLYDDLLRSRN